MHFISPYPSRGPDQGLSWDLIHIVLLAAEEVHGPHYKDETRAIFGLKQAILMELTSRDEGGAWGQEGQMSQSGGVHRTWVEGPLRAHWGALQGFCRPESTPCTLSPRYQRVAREKTLLEHYGRYPKMSRWLWISMGKPWLISWLDICLSLAESPWQGCLMTKDLKHSGYITEVASKLHLLGRHEVRKPVPLIISDVTKNK